MSDTVDNPNLFGLPVSNQSGPHDDLAALVKRHRDTPTRRPIAEHTKAAFEVAHDFVTRHPTVPIILDSCCGRGDSSFWAAKTFPGHLVVGLDKSGARLGRQEEKHPNVLLLQADVRDFWRLAEAQDWQLARHHVFYPNPYPKASQVQKRWHASSAFPSLTALGGVCELRTNFGIYALEWQISLKLWGKKAHLEDGFSAAEPASLFEKKYHERGQKLYRVTASL